MYVGRERCFHHAGSLCMAALHLMCQSVQPSVVHFVKKAGFVIC